DLGWFERGRMVPEFESAVEALEPDAVSPVITTRFGLHIIKLLDREQPSFEEVGATFRDELQTQRAEAFEQAYIDSLVAAANVEIEDGAVETAREIARVGAGGELSRAHARETLVRYRGGSFTAREFHTFLATTPPQTASYFGQGNDEQVQFGLRRLAQDELLVRAARHRGLTVDSVIADSLRTLALRRILSVARSAGLRRDALAGSDTLVDRAVHDLLTGALQGRRRIGTLGVVGLALREKHPTRVYDERLPQVAQRAEQLRTGADTVPSPTGPADSVPASPGESADTTPDGR
ncbi:MAG: peptidylprolyl isomerase, partial [Gemmatimonadota bacterium]